MRRHPLAPGLRSWSARAAFLGTLLLAGCVSLRPFDEITRELGPGSWVALPGSGQRVAVVQAGSGEPLVLLHGFGESSASFSAVIPELSRRFRVVAIDLNGFGYTERLPEPSNYTLEGQARLVLGVLDRLGYPRVRLAGHSYGGGLALYLADRHPERVERLLLIDNTLPRYAQVRRNGAWRWRWLAGLAVRTFALSDARIRSGLREAYLDDSRVTRDLVRTYAERLRVEGAVDAFLGLVGPSEEPAYELDLATIRQPTLVVWGENDTLIMPDAARTLTVRMPDARFVTLPACGHTPMEECPQPFLAAVLPFLEAR